MRDGRHQFAQPVLALAAAAIAAGPAIAVIQTVELGYAIRYQQTGPLSPPVLQHFQFFSRLTTDLETDLFTAFVRPTASAAFPSRELVDIDGGFTYEFLSGTYATELAVRTDFPAGGYLFSISGGTLGSRSTTFNGPATLLWPTLVPRFFSTTYNAISVGVSSYQPITLTFNTATLPAGASSGSVSIRIRDTTDVVVYSTELPITAGSAVIPADTLDPGVEHTAELRFEVVSNFPGAAFSGGAGQHRFQRSTTCLLITNEACLADFNGFDGVNTTDLFDFLNSWFAGSPAANVDGAVGVTTSDVFFFLNAWFQRC